MRRCIKNTGALPRGGPPRPVARRAYRLGRGDYRVIYSIDDKDALIDIIKIGLNCCELGRNSVELRVWKRLKSNNGGAKMKRCSRCKKLKDESKFARQRRGRDGLSSWCKKCRSEYSYWYYQTGGKHAKKYRSYEDSHRVVDGVKQKRCPKCKGWKDESEFGKGRSRRDGLADACRKCERKRVRKYYGTGPGCVKRHYKYEQTHRIVEGVKEKRCRKCSKWKPESEFSKHRYSKDGLDVWCKKCLRKAHKQRLAERN
ncbi:MAG: type II toxin-antitoxin system RelE/ParE family toxin [Planctomycetes bacterium]|nr:type II toxin-antitoxin system RelE/ParE family toxin [Planctomycetota bacterium]